MEKHAAVLDSSEGPIAFPVPFASAPDVKVVIVSTNEAEVTDTDPLAGLKALAKQVAKEVRQVDGEVLIDDRLFAKSRGSGSGPDLLTPIVVNAARRF